MKKIEEKNEKEKMNLTFKPEINDNSRKIVESKNKKEKIEDRLIKLGNKYNQKLSKSKEEDNKKFTFMPIINKEAKELRRKKRKNLLNQINHINNKMTKDSKNGICKTEIILNKSSSNINNNIKKNIQNINGDNHISPLKNNNSKNVFSKKKPILSITPNKNIFDYLYIESELLQQKRENEIQKIMDLNYPFKPKLINSFHKQINNRESNVFARLYKNKINNYKDKYKIMLKNIYDSKRNNEIYSLTNNFKRIIKTKSPDKIHRRHISEDNTQSYKKILNDNIKNNQIMKDNFENMNKIDYLKKSNNIITKAKTIKYKELFNSLDCDKDGLISYKKIKLSGLNFHQLISLTSILNELQYKGTEMDLNMFVERIEKISII